jgi:hypothetical protein
VVGFRVNYEGAGPSPSDFSLYRASFIEPADGVERVANADFSSGAQSWELGGQAVLTVSDLGTGRRVVVQASSAQQAWLTSFAFSVDAGTSFRAAFDARVSPSSAGSGYFMVIFLRSNTEFFRETASLGLQTAPVGPTVTDAAGEYGLDISSLGGGRLILEASYAGGARAWPAYARVGP